MNPIALFSAVMIAAPASAQWVGEKSGVNSALGISPTTAEFVKHVAISDIFELQSNSPKSAAMQRRKRSRPLKDHTKTSEELKALVKNGDVKEELPTGLDSGHQSKLDQISSYKECRL